LVVIFSRLRPACITGGEHCGVGPHIPEGSAPAILDGFFEESSLGLA
jgi:hypothetical protein